MIKTPYEIAAEIVRTHCQPPHGKKEYKWRGNIEFAIGRAIQSERERAGREYKCDLTALLDEATNFESLALNDTLIKDVFGISGLILPSATVAAVIRAIAAKMESRTARRAAL